ncbi:PQQ-binding-like beta-propeller repeat protein, partial [Patescibacteria group bacterium]|nr:PQQ-binding-like beta-propeller repeat protein [Patescibacteria group bacterium]
TNNIKWNNNSITGWWSQAFGIAPIVGKDDTIYIGNESQGKLYALNSDGTTKWTFPDNNNPLGTQLSMPAVADDGTVYIGSDSGIFYAVNPNGTLKWKYTLDPVRQIGGSPVIGADGTVYFSTIFASTNSLYALNSDGTLKWTFDVNKGSQTTTANPAIGSDGTIYMSFWEDGLYALNPDKSIKWQDNELTVGSPLVGSDGTIYVIIARASETGNLLLALNPDGTEKWTYSGVDRMIKPAVSSDGIIFAKGRHVNGQYVTEFWAIKSNGTLKWKNTEIGYAYLSTPAIGSDGTVYIATIKGLYALDSIDGTIKWKGLGLCCSSPAIGSDGVLYYGTYDRGIYAFGE